MSEKRPDLPYEKAAEETAKAVGKGFDLIDKASPAIADIYNVIIGDRLSEYRKRNADKFARKTKRIIDERNLKDKREVPESLAAPLLDAAMRDPRDELLELYAALAANAMDPGFHDDVRPEFVETVKSWQPLDLRVMHFAIGLPQGKPAFGIDAILKALGTERRNAVTVSIEHLKTLGCLSNPTPSSISHLSLRRRNYAGGKRETRSPRMNYGGKEAKAAKFDTFEGHRPQDRPVRTQRAAWRPTRHSVGIVSAKGGCL